VRCTVDQWCSFENSFGLSVVFRLEFLVLVFRCGSCMLLVVNACIVIPAKARDYVFTSVGLSVCLFVCLLPR